MNQKRLPPRLIGCLAPRLVDGPGTTTSSLSSLELGVAWFVFFVAGGLAGGGEKPDATVFLVGFRASLNDSELDVEWTTFFLPTGSGERVFGAFTGEVGFSNTSCPSSEASVAESSSDFAFGGPVSSASCSCCCGFVPAYSNQSGTWIKQVSAHPIAC